MLKFGKGGLQQLALAGRMSRPHARSVVRSTAGMRLQSSSSGTSISKSKEENQLSDEKVDEWLEAIQSLKAEFSDQGFIPETSLAPPGQTRIDILEEVMSVGTKFTPSPEQVEEWESLKNVVIPQRKDPVLQHVTNMIMRHGKKQRAERILSRALYLVFCQTRQDPVEVLKKSLDDLAPLMMVKTFNTGVAKAAVIPVPLNQRQRSRLAWKWIVESADKRASSDFAVRLGEELVAVFKGNSSGFEKRDQMHKTAIAHRSYIRLK